MEPTELPTGHQTSTVNLTKPGVTVLINSGVSVAPSSGDGIAGAAGDVWELTNRGTIGSGI